MPHSAVESAVMTAITNATHEALAGGRVKGAMVRAHLQFVRDRIGEAALEATVAAIPEEGAGESNATRVLEGSSDERFTPRARPIAPPPAREPHLVMRELGRYSAQI